MQAIITKYLPATNTKPTRIKAFCERGSLTTSVTSHIQAASLLCDKFATEDLNQRGEPKEKNPWNKPRVCGQLPNGDCAHVFTS